MTADSAIRPDGERTSALDMKAAEFRQVGHRLIEQIAGFYESLPDRALTTGEKQSQIRELLGTGGLPVQGVAAGDLLDDGNSVEAPDGK